MNDFRYAFRQLLKNPGFTVVAVLTLALGIGANTAIFSVVNAVLLRPLPVKDAAGLLAICYQGTDGGLSSPNVSFPYYRMYRDESRSFSEFIGYAPVSAAIKDENRRETVPIQLVSGNYFTALGVRPILGRVLSPADDQVPGRDPVAVISYQCWQQRFGGIPDVLGKTVNVNTQELTIVGVAPEGFRGLYLFVAPELWTPTAMEGALGGHTVYQMVGRLAPGVSRANAIAELNAITARFAEIYGHGAPPGYERYGFLPRDQRTTLVHAALGSWGPQRGGRERVTTLAGLFMGAVGLVLLIACANAANLLLVRALKRRKEIAIRLALGASRTRLIRQLVAESVVLAFIGAALGLLLAKWGTDALISLRTGTFKLVPIDAGADVRVLAFTATLAVLTGLIFGLAPALQALRFDLHPTLKNQSLGVAARHVRFPLRNMLVISQVSLCFVLLAGAGLCLRSFAKLVAIDPGFEPKNVLITAVGLDRDNYSKESALALLDEIVGRVNSMPGVGSVALSDGLLPLSGNFGDRGLNELEGYAKKPNEHISFGQSDVGPDYFRTLGVPLLQGREFNPHDRLRGRRVLIVNQSFVQRYWPGQNPIGKPISDGEVVGVVRDSRIQQVWTEPAPHVYRSKLQGDVHSFSLLVKTEGDPHLLIPQIRRELKALDSLLEPAHTDTLQNIWSTSLGGQKLLMTLVGVFAGLAMVLAMVGLYGVMSYTVAQRWREIGVRMALGARPRDLLTLVVGEGMTLVVVGLGIGGLTALGATQLLGGLLYEVKPTDTITFLGVLALLAGVGCLACILPARRATSVHPMEALRYE